MTIPATDPAGAGPADTIRVERGVPTDEELAALALVLMARSCGSSGEEETPQHCPTAPWRVPGHRVARSWRAAPAPAAPAVAARRP
ncbi:MULTISPECIES: acyl-CoA carboxylase epsilon subunit [unclassified Streptomyces]|uniref:Acyl-CoA carboxylase epsilon subunit n=1 Tax=Streptomyces sp. R35 TaxID=3238630 RepID=A0AB39S7C5_9ACTN|nr:acyl-CoA carboxylase subunit epsilon [Streptomyces sp. NBC_01236]